jgi:hypothetical protein
MDGVTACIGGEDMIPWSTPDIGNITNVLRDLLDQGIAQYTAATGLSTANIKVSCDAPDTRKAGDPNCYLTVYLLHVGRDPFWRNTPVQGSRGQLNNAQPLSITLSYLLTAWSDKDYTSEQRAMSIALQTFQSFPIVTKNLIDTVLKDGWPTDGEFVISLQADTIEEMSRLWQAFTVPMRLSALIKVSVVFLQTLNPPTIPYIPPQSANLAVSLLAPPLRPVTPPNQPPQPQLIGGLRVAVAPPDVNTTPATLAPTYGPPVAVGDGAPVSGQEMGGSVAVAGVGLDLTNASHVYLGAQGGQPWDVTLWRQGVAKDWLWLALPNAYADPSKTAPPGATPPPGLYNLTVGDGLTNGFRSNSVQIAIAPRVDSVTNPPTLGLNASNVYPITGGGFVQGPATSILFGSQLLTFSATGPTAGHFTVDPTGAQIAFLPPTGLPHGPYPVQVFVNGIAATAGWVVTL